MTEETLHHNLRAKDGRFTPSLLLSPGDFIHRCFRRGDCLLIPSFIPAPFGQLEGGENGKTRRWRIQTSRVRGAEAYFPSSSRPSLRAILWAFHFSQAPPSRLRPTCGEPNCINPLHQGVTMSLPAELCARFFQEALSKSYAGETLELRIPSEGDAIRYRAALNRWRKEQREQNLSLGTDYDSLILRLRPEDERKPHGPFILFVDTPSEDFESILDQALGSSSSPTIPATDLALQLMGKHEEESE